MDFDEIEEFDLSPIVAHNANFELGLAESPSPEGSPAPELGAQVQQRPISKRRGKKRSSRACASCRARKVRCNIVAHGAPCSNCKHDEVDCVLPLSRRQRAAKERAEQQQRELQVQEQGRNPAAILDACNSSRWQARDVVASPEPITTLSPPHGMTVSEHVLCEILPAHSASQVGSPELRPILPPTATKRHSQPMLCRIKAPLATAQFHSPSKFPKIFAPLPGHLSTTDVSYLAARSAFSLPSEALQVVLIHAFMEYVHPSLPIVDLSDLLDTIKTGKGRKISLLLFQSMMLSGIEYVSERVLKSEYPGMNKATITLAMAAKVKLLYDFDTTTDRLTIIQSLLLLSHSLSHQPQFTYKNAHHYLGLALSLAFSLGIHRNPPPSQDVGSATDSNTAVLSSLHLSAMRRRKLERRIWWSLYLQDKLLEIGGQGEGRLRAEDFDANILDMTDFDLRDSDDDREENDSVKETVQAQALVEKVKLARWGQQVTLRTSEHSIMHRTTKQNIQTSSPSSSTHFQQTTQQPLSTNEDNGRLSSPHNHSYCHSYATSSSTNDDADQDQDMDCQTPQDEFLLTPHALSLDSMDTQKELTQISGSIDGKGVMIVNKSSREGASHDGSLVLGGGFGVDGEYDDYLEYFRG